MSDTAPVSIIIAAFNAQATIRRAVQTALQEQETSQVIVVDDGSTDQTMAEAWAADDGTRRVVLIHTRDNNGPAAARNRALQECRASWVGVLDADDYFLPGRLRRLLRYGARADFIADDLWRVREGEVNGFKPFFDGIPKPRLLTFREFVISNSEYPRRHYGDFGFIKPLMRRGFIEANHLRYRETMRLGEDYEFYARAMALGARLMLVPPQGYVSIMRKNSLSANHSIEAIQNLRDCDQDLLKIASLTGEDRNALRHHSLGLECRLQWRRLIDAVKRRNVRDAARAFAHPMPVPLFLLERLFEQALVRSRRKFDAYRASARRTAGFL